MADYVSFTSGSGGDPVQELRLLFAGFLPSSEDMLRAANGQIARIRERTAEGMDVNGNPFAPYTPQYAKARAKRGLPVSPVDLQSSGRMLGSLQSEVLSPNSFAISVTDTQAEQYVGPVNDSRRFFDTSKEELEQMANDLRSQ